MQPTTTFITPPSNSAGMWDYFPHASFIKTWTRELKQAKSNPFSRSAWELMGHAVAIVCKDTEAVAPLMQHIAQAAGMALQFIPRDQILNFSEWMAATPKDQPCIVYLEPGVWLKHDLSADDSDHDWPNPPSHDEDQAYAFRKELAKYLMTTALEQPIVFVTCLQIYNQMDFNLRQAGLFDRRIQLPKLSHEDIARAFIDHTGSDLMGSSITENLKRVGCIIEYDLEDYRRRMLLQKSLQRLAWKRSGKLHFQDLVMFTVYGTAEVDECLDPPEIRQRHAVHEAGHAVMSHLDSREQLPPDYCSVLKRNNSQGVMASCYSAHEKMSDDQSYLDMLHEIRVTLAGRVAEHLLLGAEHSSADGAASDLKNATKLARLVFRTWGHSPDIATDKAASSNLAVCIDKPTSSEQQYFEPLIRHFLQTQFEFVQNFLSTHIGYLKLVTETLNTKIVMFQDDFFDLHKDYEANLLKVA
jgi:Peptidase family M41